MVYAEPSQKPTIGAQPDRLAPLVRRAAAGDEVALTELYDQTSSQVYGFALSILREQDAASEATLDVYQQVWRQAERWDAGRGRVLTWLLMLARSRSLDLARSRARRDSRQLPLEEVAELADPDPGPEERSTDAERARLIRRALATLPVEQRRAIEAAFYAGMSHVEVAEALGQPLGTVKTRIRTGLVRLRAILAAAEMDGQNA